MPDRNSASKNDPDGTQSLRQEWRTPRLVSLTINRTESGPTYDPTESPNGRSSYGPTS